MRTNYFKLLILTLIISGLLVASSFTQPPGKRGGPHPGMEGKFFEKLPGITEKQIEQIKNLKTKHMKEVLPLRNQVREKEAHLQTISTGEKVDMGKVNKTIEEISVIKLSMAKMRAAHKQQIRQLLTEDQRAVFDSFSMKKGKHRGFDEGPGKHRMPQDNKF